MKQKDYILTGFDKSGVILYRGRDVKELAEATGLAIGYIYRILRGACETPRVNVEYSPREVLYVWYSSEYPHLPLKVGTFDEIFKAVRRPYHLNDYVAFRNLINYEEHKKDGYKRIARVEIYDDDLDD